MGSTRGVADSRTPEEAAGSRTPEEAADRPNHREVAGAAGIPRRAAGAAGIPRQAAGAGRYRRRAVAAVGIQRLRAVVGSSPVGRAAGSSAGAEAGAEGWPPRRAGAEGWPPRRAGAGEPATSPPGLTRHRGCPVAPDPGPWGVASKWDRSWSLPHRGPGWSACTSERIAVTTPGGVDPPRGPTPPGSFTSAVNGQEMSIKRGPRLTARAPLLPRGRPFRLPSVVSWLVPGVGGGASGVVGWVVVSFSRVREVADPKCR